MKELSTFALGVIVAQGREASNELNKRKRVDTVAIIKNYIGKYYKYSNSSYSCPEGEDDYWDIYRKYQYMGTDKFGDYEFEVAQGIEWYIDSEGEIHIKKIKEDSEHLKQWEECSEFDAETNFALLMDTIIELHRTVKVLNK